MTGGEIIAAKAIVAGLADAGAKALEDDGSTTQLQRLAEKTPEMDVAAKQYAKRIALKQTILLKLYQPLGRLMGISREYFETEFATDMAKKIADIPEEDLITPKASVAGPAMQGLAYSLDEPNLKEMYLNLLTAATDGRRSEAAHPSFAEIIRQLSAEEAPLLLMCLAQRAIACVRVKAIIVGTPKNFRLLQNNFMDWRTESGEAEEVPMAPVYVDNWIRLGLVAVSSSEFLTGNEDVDLYSWVEGRPEYGRLREQHDRPGDQMVSFDRGMLRPTNFGLRFREAVTG
jgi:hypothetical protein